MSQTTSDQKGVRDFIRTIPDFPEPGILFRDITTLFSDPAGLKLAVDQMNTTLGDRQIDKIVGLDARGFIVASPLAYLRGCGLTLVRKAGKLPAASISEAYELEYGTAEVEIHEDAVEAGEKVLVVDDLIATGGTAEAAIKLLERLGADIVGCAFVIDLPDLGGRAKLEAMGLDVMALCAFEGL